MSSDGKNGLLFKLRAASYVAFILAYISGVVIFIVDYENYWAAGGFTITIFQILARLYLFLLPKEMLFRAFPVASVSRALWQGINGAYGFAALGVGLWLFARGIQEHQAWTGESYFCSMIGVFMSSKWGFFLTIPIYELRPDLMEEEALMKSTADDRHSEQSNDPFLSTISDEKRKNAAVAQLEENPSNEPYPLSDSNEKDNDVAAAQLDETGERRGDVEMAFKE